MPESNFEVKILKTQREEDGKNILVTWKGKREDFETQQTSLFKVFDIKILLTNNSYFDLEDFLLQKIYYRFNTLYIDWKEAKQTLIREQEAARKNAELDAKIDRILDVLKGKKIEEVYVLAEKLKA